MGGPNTPLTSPNTVSALPTPQEQVTHLLRYGRGGGGVILVRGSVTEHHAVLVDDGVHDLVDQEGRQVGGGVKIPQLPHGVFLPSGNSQHA